ncbi:hypothetical protein AMR72_17340 [Flavobacterium psychrophilum]|nr:hypothetical protein AMR72_17340 [Flavobacterium psychrophilum]AOE54114.1 hypothetical protein ALW18_17330 [Flavobacterium psychrophilum]
METNKQEITFRNPSEIANPRELFEKYFYYWKWFAISIVISLLFAVLYLRYANKNYEVNAQILLNDKSKASPELAALTDATASFTGTNSNASVNDQIKIMKSRRLMYKIIQQSRLNVNYFNHGNITKIEVLAKHSPVQIKFEQDTAYTSYNFSGKLEIKTINLKQFEIVEGDLIKPGIYHYYQPIPTSLGAVTFIPNVNNIGKVVNIQFQPITSTVQKYIQKISVTPDDDANSMIVNFALVDNIKERAILIVNSLINSYSLESKEDESKLAEATASFINERLQLITSDLENVDKNLEDYKTKNNLNNTETEAVMFLTDALAADKEVVTQGAQLQIAQHLQQTLQNNKNSLLPSNIGIQDAALSETISNYNQLVLEQQQYSKSMTPNNPTMVTLLKNIEDLRINILSSLKMYVRNLQASLNLLQNTEGGLNNKLKKLPKQERGFRNIARQQQIVEAIYLFLLQKREEAEIRATATIDTLKIVDEAYTTNTPVTPKNSSVYFWSILLGFFVPFTLLFLKFLLSNTIKDKKDFNGIYSGPFLGDIPTSDDEITGSNDRSGLAESLRIIRSNLNFILPKTTYGKVIYVTSTLPGEGKTFTAVNLAQILALTKKTVIVLGADVRVPKILDYLNLTVKNMGLTTLLANHDVDVNTVILKQPDNYLFDILPAGIIPPNPAELLMDERFKEIVTELKNRYDYVIVDTAPVGMVSDTQIIAEYADATLFIARSNYLDKRLTTVLQDMYLNKKLKNIGLIINDVNYNKGYGYGYGYGYEYNDRKKSFFKSIKRRGFRS